VETPTGHSKPLDLQVYPSNALHGKMEQSHLHPPSISCTYGSLHTVHLQMVSRFPNIGRRTGGFFRRYPLREERCCYSTGQYGFNCSRHCPTTTNHNSREKSDQTSPNEAFVREKPLDEVIQASTHNVGTLDRFLWCTISPWLAGHDAENEGAGGWSARCGILPNFRVVAPTSPS